MVLFVWMLSMLATSRKKSAIIRSSCGRVSAPRGCQEGANSVEEAAANRANGKHNAIRNNVKKEPNTMVGKARVEN